MSQVPSRPDMLYARLRGDILTLALAPDTPLRLPSLVARYETGLTPLRDCLNRLTAEQLVVPHHNKGFRVAALARSELLDLEASRSAIEGAMVMQSVPKRDDVWEAGVIGTFHQLSQTQVPSFLNDDEGLALWNRRHQAFHHALSAGSPSVWMHRFARQLEDLLGRYHRYIQQGLRDLASTAPERADHVAEVFSRPMAIEPHRAMYDAALAADQAALRAAFDAHAGLSVSVFEELSTLMPDGPLGVEPAGPDPETITAKGDL